MLEKALLSAGVRWEIGSDLSIGGGHGHAAARGTFDEALHDEKGFVNLFQSRSIFANGNRQGRKSDRAAVEFVNHRFEETGVHFVETVLIDLDHDECGFGNLGSDFSVGTDLSVIADPAEEVVGDARSAAGSRCDDESSFVIEIEIEDAGRARDDEGELFLSVVIETIDESKARAQWGSEHARTGGGADESEFGQLKLNRAGGWAGVDDDVETIVFHRWVEIFLDGGMEAVDFVDEENIASLEISKNTREIAGFFDLWA